MAPLYRRAVLAGVLGSPVLRKANGARFSAPLCILGKMFAPLCGVNICVWRFAPNIGGVAALATINDGASLLIEGEVAKPKVLTEGLYPLTRYSVYTMSLL